MEFFKHGHKISLTTASITDSAHQSSQYTSEDQAWIQIDNGQWHKLKKHWSKIKTMRLIGICNNEKQLLDVLDMVLIKSKYSIEFLN